MTPRRRTPATARRCTGPTARAATASRGGATARSAVPAQAAGEPDPDCRANRGVFPADRVAQIIHGRQTVRTHGTSDMPVWGLVFGRSAMVSTEADVDARIHALVEYLESIQERPGE